jgi:hypothetical protein
LNFELDFILFFLPHGFIKFSQNTPQLAAGMNGLAGVWGCKPLPQKIPMAHSAKKLA